MVQGMSSEQIQAVIMVTKGSDTAIVARLDGTSVLIGREAPADIVIDNQFVSRQHALVSLQSEGYAIVDRGSKNGTQVNGVDVGSTPVSLANGDVIRIADGEVEMRYQVSSATATIRSTAESTTTPTVMSKLAVDVSTRTVSVNGVELDPPIVGRQWSLLAYLFEAGGKACGWDELYSAGWPDRNSGMIGRNEVVQAVHEIRKRLANSGSEVDIVSVRGFGYRLGV